MAISEEFQPIYNEFVARETVIRSDASAELPPFQIAGDIVGFRFIMTTFDNGEIDATQAIEELTQLLEKYYGTVYTLAREMRGPSWGRW